MSAYIVFQRESVEDQDALDRYSARASTTFEGHPVTALVAYGSLETLEGSAVQGVVILEFPTVDDALGWYHGPTYQDVVQDRFAGATYRAVLVQGVSPAGS